LHFYYNADSNDGVELVKRDWLDCFREIMRNPEFKKHFDLIFRPMFDAAGGRLIGPACTGFWWERIQKKLGLNTAAGAAQLYFDETFQKKSQGVDTGSVSSMNMSQDAKFQTSSIKMYCLMPTYDADAAAAAGLSPEQIRKRKMEVLQACIAVFVRDINQYSSQGQEVDILCPDGKVYSMPILLMCLALDHEATEKHCLKAANGCLSCACSQDDFADATGRAFSPMMVEDVIMRIEEASAEYLDHDGNILDGKIGAVERWEHDSRYTSTRSSCIGTTGLM